MQMIMKCMMKSESSDVEYPIYSIYTVSYLFYSLHLCCIYLWLETASATMNTSYPAPIRSSVDWRTHTWASIPHRITCFLPYHDDDDDNHNDDGDDDDDDDNHNDDGDDDEEKEDGDHNDDVNDDDDNGMI